MGIGRHGEQQHLNRITSKSVICAIDSGVRARNRAPGTNENWRCLDDTAPVGNGTRHLFIPATFWAAYVKSSRLIKRQRRGFALGVYGGLGHHRMPLVGSGDTVQAWETLAWEVYMTTVAANSVIAWTRMNPVNLLAFTSVVASIYLITYT